jgi:hypothetical protein
MTSPSRNGNGQHPGDWYGIASTPAVSVPPYPERGDKEGWASWWQAFNAAYRGAGASADGIFPEEEPPAPPALASHIFAEECLLSSGECCALSRDEITELVRDVLAAELPDAVAFLLKRSQE